jgi:hypothetical protein
MRFDDLERRSPEDRREVNPPIDVESATWSAAGTLDWWVKERREWYAVRTAGSGGSGLLIFVLRAGNSPWSASVSKAQHPQSCGRIPP